ncbi:unnamed protein product [Polarella glacialis]|uniref:tRNA/rRNA methyltransferase SpoU type domain-containing protein n=1 Tax=Polarella glacialis TaxID=89957 RepID=A0A813HAC0_POLGL|nr:unnamed protein product [Polarella glacialis]
MDDALSDPSGIGWRYRHGRPRSRNWATLAMFATVYMLALATRAQLRPLVLPELCGAFPVQVIRDASDARLALYRWKTRRSPEEYTRQVQGLADRALQKAGLRPGPSDPTSTSAAPRSTEVSSGRLRPRMLRRRSGSACFETELGCAVGIHHGWECLRQARAAVAAGGSSPPVLDSVLLPQSAPKEFQELAAASVPPGRAFSVGGKLMREFFYNSAGLLEVNSAESEAGSEDDEVPCRFAVAYPVPRPLAALRPPVVVLDGLGSAMNFGQLIHSARRLGVTSFVASKAAWSALNGRAAVVSHGWLYHAEFHLAESVPVALEQLRDMGVRLYAAEEFFPVPVSPHRPGHGDSRNWALVLGAEDRGVSSEALALCDEGISVPQKRGASLNVATAATLCLHELSRHMQQETDGTLSQATFIETNSFTQPRVLSIL